MALWDLLETAQFHQTSFPLSPEQAASRSVSCLGLSGSSHRWLPQYLCTLNPVLASASERAWTDVEGGVDRAAAEGSEILSPSLGCALT